MRCLLLIFLVLLCFQGYAQPVSPRFKRIGIEQGLSYNTVHAIFQDSRGYLWFGTEDGLNRYDGFSFTVYTSSPGDTTTLANNNIHALCEDREGNLWIGTSSGLHSYHPKSGKFQAYALDLDAEGNIKPRIITDILLQADGTLWIGTGNGLIRFHPKSSQVQAFYHDPSDSQSLSSNSIMQLQADGQRGLWIATFGGGLNYYNFQTKRFTHYRHEPANPNSLSSDKLRGLRLDAEGRLWVGTYRHGLNSFDPKMASWTRYAHDPHNPYSIGDNRISTIKQFPDKPELLWIGTDEGGLSVLNLSSGRFSNFAHDPLDASSLSHNAVYAIFQDRQGKVWLGTEIGINVVDPNPSPFEHYRNSAAEPALLSDNFVVSLCADRGGNLWLGSKGSGLTKLDMKTGQSQHYRHDPAKPGSLGDNVIQSLYEDRMGTLWVGTAAAGLHRYQPEDESFVQYRNNHLVEEHRYQLNDIHVIFEDSRGRFWLGTHGGLYQFDRNSGTFTSYQHDPENPQSISSNVINRIVEDRAGSLWVSTFVGGLNKFDPEKRTFKRYLHQPGKAESLSNDRINALFVDSGGDLWIGTHQGLNRYNPEGETFEVFLQKDGLPDDRIYGILEDDSGRLWLSTSNGLSQFDRAQKQFRNFTVEDGLQSNSFAGQINLGAHCKGPDGLLYFGGHNGFNRVNPLLLRTNRQQPAVVLTGIQIHNKPLPIATEVDQLQELALGYEDNVLSFEFAALDYAQPQKNQYAYKLQGFNEEWIYSGSRRFASYTNLDPGEYIFRVKAANNDGIWNEEGTSIRISIAVPPWKSWWAYGLYFLLMGSILYTFWRYSLKQQQLQHSLALERMESEKLHELDQLKSRFFANISHEFRTPLSLLLGPLEQLLKNEKENSPTKGYYQLMQRNGQRLLQLINQLLDLSKIEAGSMKVQLQPLDLVQELTLGVALFSSLAESKGVSLCFHTTEKQLYTKADLDKLQKILYNLLSNACKFTPTGGRIDVELKVSPADAFYKIEVADTGIGMATEKLERIFDRFYQIDTSPTRQAEGTGIGLSLSRELVQLLRGHIQVESRPGEGSRFSIRLPLLPPDLPMAEAPETPYELPVSMPQLLPSAAEPDPELEEGKNGALQSKKPLLLLIEDNADLRRYIRSGFSAAYRVLEARDGLEGHALAIAQVPDLIISDLMMPQRDGHELCRLLRQDERTSHIPIILLTAKASSQSKLEGLEVGADDYLTKPFSTEELKLRVKNLIAQRRRLRKRYSSKAVLQPKDIAVTSADERFLQRALALVEQHIADPDFSVEGFGRELGMSRMQLHRKLSALTGQSASEFIRSLRLQRAAALIRQQWGNVAEVGFAVGFQNLSYFSKCFKEMYKTTPSDYATENKQGQKA